KHGDGPKPSAEQKEASKLTDEEWNTFFAGHWNFGGERQDKHLAMFPEELPKRLIKMFSFVGETVIDPFLGSGTTALAAKNLGRNSIGYEINPEFLPLIRQKVGEPIEVVSRKTSLDLKDRLDGVPYRFEDPLKVEKQVDPRKMSFGSRVELGRTVRDPEINRR